MKLYHVTDRPKDVIQRGFAAPGHEVRGVRFTDCNNAAEGQAAFEINVSEESVLPFEVRGEAQQVRVFLLPAEMASQFTVSLAKKG
jgi:hypothetical protein